MITEEGKNIEDKPRAEREGTATGPPQQSPSPPGDMPLHEGEDNSINTTQPPTADMEVHHHPDVHHKPKPWKEYLLEGLMIFIAVTLGFFAEGLRESIGDHKKEKEYMAALVNDLKSDTGYIIKNINYIKDVQAGIDSLITCLNKPLTDTANAKLCLIYYYKYGVTAVFTPFAEGTITQLKNNGGLRLIEQPEIVDEINTYEATKMLNIKYNDAILQHLRDIINNKFTRLFNFNSVRQLALVANADVGMSTKNVAALSALLAGLTPKLADASPNLIAEISNNYFNWIGELTSYLKLLQRTQQSAEKLLALIEKEYHPE